MMSASTVHAHLVLQMCSACRHQLDGVVGDTWVTREEEVFWCAIPGRNKFVCFFVKLLILPVSEMYHTTGIRFSAGYHQACKCRDWALLNKG